MIKNGMWYVLSLPKPCNKDKTWDIFFNQFIFTMHNAKLYIKDLKQGSKADKYMVQNLTCSGA